MSDELELSKLAAVPVQEHRDMQAELAAARARIAELEAQLVPPAPIAVHPVAAAIGRMRLPRSCIVPLGVRANFDD